MGYFCMIKYVNVKKVLCETVTDMERYVNVVIKWRISSVRNKHLADKIGFDWLGFTVYTKRKKSGSCEIVKFTSQTLFIYLQY